MVARRRSTTKMLINVAASSVPMNVVNCGVRSMRQGRISIASNVDALPAGNKPPSPALSAGLFHLLMRARQAAFQSVLQGFKRNTQGPVHHGGGNVERQRAERHGDD